MAEKDTQTKESSESLWLRFLRVSRSSRLFALFGLSLIVVLSSIVLAYLCWFLWLPKLWGWGFTPVSWRAIFAVLGALYLVMIPLMPFVSARQLLGPILCLYAEDKLQKKVDEIADKQSDIEDELITKDTTGLIQLIRYSRLQLTAYYSIGLDQTRKSFRYSVLAMWIGFLVIIFGVTYTFLIEPPKGADTPNSRILTVAGGTVIEVISALFLWVYSRSVTQLTYFYNRQSYNHNILFCTSIASTMSDSEETKRMIIEKVLDQTWEVPAIGAPRLGRIPFPKKSHESTT